MKATVIVSKDADFSHNPVGFVDVNPIPDAARQGLQAALLTTRSVKAATLDRVSGQFLDVDVDLDNDVVFEEDGVKLLDRQTGFIAEDWPSINYSGGFTIIAVYDTDTEFDGSTGSPVLASLDAGTNLPLQPESRGFRVGARLGESVFMVTNEANTHAVRFRRSFLQSEGPVFTGHSYNPTLGTNGRAISYVSSRGTSASEENLQPKDPGPVASPDAGVSILREPRASDVGDRDRKVSFIAQYNRPMTEEEIEEIYLTLKPWLSGLGVEVE